MRRLFAALVLIFGTGLLISPVSAQTPNPQQERMKTCNTQAASQKLSGDARKTFMSDCLSGKTTAAKPLTAQQQKMKDCNATASGKKLTGDARKTFMSSCLKGS